MTMRLSGPGTAFCDECLSNFVHTLGDPPGTIRHSWYQGWKRCSDSEKLFELPPLSEYVPDEVKPNG